jgi:hypothetical protein
VAPLQLGRKAHDEASELVDFVSLYFPRGDADYPVLGDA